jgi:heat shock protein HslJ
MKKAYLLLAITLVILVGCAKKVTTTHDGIKHLEGTWELNYISGPRIAFEGLFPERKPTIIFDAKENRFAGFAGCNQYFGTPIIENSNLILDKMGVTMMACMDGNGENVYLNTLKKINRYSISSDHKELTLLVDDIAMMRYVRK